jgi:hypothetical protein
MKKVEEIFINKIFNLFSFTSPRHFNESVPDLIHSICAAIDEGMSMGGSYNPKVRGRMIGDGYRRSDVDLLVPRLGIGLEVGEVMPSVKDRLFTEVIEAMLEFYILISAKLVH